MKYIVSEEELRLLCSKIRFNPADIHLKDSIGELLESKQPIELIAEGEVNADTQSFNGEEWCYVEDKDGELTSVTGQIEKYNGKSISIYVEVKE